MGPTEGDRTYGVFNVVPRTGFERDNEADLTVSGGNFGQTNDYAERWRPYGPFCVLRQRERQSQ